ncbi:MAG TPA: HypC/HybG/HupF family hydrogenase formation chaperone [Candidatus Angelobacter sp.]|nr:HypC/HybG/HupF family hydrogenase formation chaperone [Candidatus Angelobacter sp.]
MCLTAPARVLAVDGDVAVAEVAGRRYRVSTLPVPDVQPGDWALMTAGTLVRVLDPDAAAELAAAVHVAAGAPR